MAALSVEFVAKPQEAHRVEAAIPAAIAGGAGDDRLELCSLNARWVHALLKPYLDRCLRVQTMVALLPVLPAIRPETFAAGECSEVQDLLSQEENICVA